MKTEVVIVGGGISAAACANSLANTNSKLQIRVLDKASRPGGRLGARTLRLLSGPHEVDIGAAYLTASQPDFVKQVAQWCDRGLLRPWTNTLGVYTDGRPQEPTTGPMRFAARDGLRSLARDSLERAIGQVSYHPNIDVTEVDRATSPATKAVIFACPVPQALRVMAKALSHDQTDDLARFSSQPVITAWGWFDKRDWPDFNAAFINDDPTLSLIADDGSRRGDNAAVLVAHSTNAYAQAHPAIETSALELMTEVMNLLNIDEPLVGSGAHRWGLAKPTISDPRPFWSNASKTAASAPAAVAGLAAGTNKTAKPRSGTDLILGICGDEWGGPSKVETAWLSGHRLGRFVAESLSL